MSAHYRCFWKLREWAREEGLQSFSLTEKAFFLRVLLMWRLRVLKKLWSHASGMDFLSHRDLIFLVQGTQLHAHGIDEWIHESSHGVVLWWRNFYGCHEAFRWGIQQVLLGECCGKYEFINASLCGRVALAHEGWKLVALAFALIKEIHAYAHSHALKILVVVITLHILMHILFLLHIYQTHTPGDPKGGGGLFLCLYTPGDPKEVGGLFLCLHTPGDPKGVGGLFLCSYDSRF